MAKNIALFIDGTWNRPTGAKDTNVRHLFNDANALVGPGQVCHYMSGVGTEVGGFKFVPSFLRRGGIERGLDRLPRWFRNALGGAFGWGTAFRIKEAYAFLCDHYLQGDHVFLFGFSRGAFAARSLAGFVEQVGILYRDKLELVETAYAMYEAPSEAARNALRDNVHAMAGRPGPFVEGEFALPIYMIGVWDTVAALGIPRRQAELPGYFTEHHRPELPSNVTHARHALALHELRRKFEPLLWNSCAHWQTLRQVWFAGAHADVGGGYEARYLSDAALGWMAREAQKVGLELAICPTQQGSPLGPDRVHHELRGIFTFSRSAVRKCLTEQRYASVAQQHLLHRSVVDRLRDANSSRYRYMHPGVNNKLRQADELALKMLVQLGRQHVNAICQ